MAIIFRFVNVDRWQLSGLPVKSNALIIILKFVILFTRSIQRVEPTQTQENEISILFFNVLIKVSLA